MLEEFLLESHRFRMIQPVGNCQSTKMKISLTDGTFWVENPYAAFLATPA